VKSIEERLEALQKAGVYMSITYTPSEEISIYVASYLPGTWGTTEGCTPTGTLSIHFRKNVADVITEVEEWFKLPIIREEIKIVSYSRGQKESLNKEVNQASIQGKGEGE